MKDDRAAHRGKNPPVVWAIGGTDPSAGAGLPADIKTLQALGVYAAPIVTAVVVQNARAVWRVQRVSGALIRAQMEALQEDFPPSVVKIGMLGGAPAVRAVADGLSRLTAPAVCDPVLASTSGTTLLDEAGVHVFVSRLLPRVDVLTPNLPEAERLTGMRIARRADMPPAAARLRAMGAKAVVLKGGHLADGVSADYFTDGRESLWLVGPRHCGDVHGTGCVFASALAAGLALGRGAAQAARLAKAYIRQALRRAMVFGDGRLVPAHAGWPSVAR